MGNRVRRGLVLKLAYVVDSFSACLGRYGFPFLLVEVPSRCARRVRRQCPVGSLCYSDHQHICSDRCCRVRRHADIESRPIFRRNSYIHTITPIGQTAPEAIETTAPPSPQLVSHPIPLSTPVIARQHIFSSLSFPILVDSTSPPKTIP